MKQPTLIAALLLLSASALPAAARTTMTVSGSGSDKATFEVTDNLVLDFGSTPGSIVVKESPSKQQVFAITDNTVLAFEEQSGVAEVRPDAVAIALRTNPVEQSLDFTAAPAEACALSVFSLQGSLLLSLPAWQGESVDVSSLAPGLYIVSFNNQSIKFYKK